MDHLLQLSNIACQAERLEVDANSSGRPSSAGTSLSASPTTVPSFGVPRIVVPIATAPSSSSSSSSSSSNNTTSPASLKSNAVEHSMPVVPQVQSSPSTQRKSISEKVLPSDRETIRDKIKMAYRKKAESFDELLDLCSALTEQHILDDAPTKLDYYKNGISCCKQIFDLGNELNDQNSNGNKADPSGDAPKGVKRTKTQH